MDSSTTIIAMGAILLMYTTCSMATVYTVGDSSGWTTGYDYSNWASSKTFAIGDKLAFNYAPSTHTVNEVTAGDYNACSTSSYLTTDNKGSTTITLKTAGTHYFICGIPGHCSDGMKLSVSISSGSAGSTPSTTTAPAGNNNAAASSRARMISSAVAVAATMVMVTV